MKKTRRRLACLALIGMMSIQFPVTQAKAEVIDGDTSLGGITAALERYYESLKTCREAKDSTELFSVEYEVPENIAIANVTSTLNIRKQPSVSSSKKGMLSRYAACIVESIDQYGWAKVTSGDVTGYVNASYLITGEEAEQIAREEATLYATVNAGVTGLNVRTKPNTNAKIITRVNGGEKLRVSKEVVISKDDPTSQRWVEVKLVDDENANAVAYVSADYVTLAYEQTWAVEYTPYGPGVSDFRVALCDYAKQFIGTPYVWGGDSLTKGIDCSGYVKKIYAKFGIETPRNSRAMAKEYAANEISIDELKPGDLIFYGKVAENYINHVGMYIGNGQVIHSSTNYKGVAISSIYFYSILKCCYVIED